MSFLVNFYITLLIQLNVNKIQSVKNLWKAWTSSYRIIKKTKRKNLGKKKICPPLKFGNNHQEIQVEAPNPSHQGGSGLGTHVHPWQIHVNVNQYSIIKYNKVKIKIKKIYICGRFIFLSSKILKVQDWFSIHRIADKNQYYQVKNYLLTDNQMLLYD